MIKERTRGIMHTLPFTTLPQSLINWLVHFVVSGINMIPNKTGYVGVSPREAFTGRKADYTRDVRIPIGFGDYAHCVVPNTTTNSMQAITEACIALLPTGNLSGSVKFLSLATRTVVTRGRWKEIPMPTSAIDFLNALASKESKAHSLPLVEALTFTLGGGKPVEDLHTEANDAEQAPATVTDNLIPRC
jgi:hypothetical protein